MHINKFSKYSDYAEYLKKNASEAKLLHKELLIGVTNFFRDKEAFELLRDKYIPELLKKCTSSSFIRVWVPACSTGEEAYTIAIIMREYMKLTGNYFRVQVFATDICEGSIELARNGIYPESIKSNLTRKQLSNFFYKKDKYYHIKKEIREMVIFATQNIIKDPPFTKIDLLSCRNLLIYFNSELQKKLINILDFSLKEGGLLLLGSSESIGIDNSNFIILNSKWKIYKKEIKEKNNYSSLLLNSRCLNYTKSKDTAVEQIQPIERLDNSFLIKLLKSLLSQSNLPPSVVVDRNGNILFIHGSTGLFLEPSQGERSFNILKMARYGMRTELLKSIKEVNREKQEVRVNSLKVKCNNSFIKFDLIIKPLPEHQTENHKIMLVMFIQKGYSKADSTVKDDIDVPQVDFIDKQEVFLTNSVEWETYNEELQSTNEDLQTKNEELQSINEELEASKEELQSLNEESNTLNSELQSRIENLTIANDDIKNLLDATEIATIFLNIDLKIRRFTPCSTHIFPLITTDVGRSITDFASSLIDIDLKMCTEKVLTDLITQELEAESRNGKKYRVKVKPYRTVNNVIDGVVITFEDITKLKRLESQLRMLSLGFEEKFLMMSKVFMDSADSIIIEDLNGMIFELNNETVKSYGWTRSELIGKHAELLLIPEHRVEFRKTIDRCRNKGVPVQNLKEIRIHKSGKHIPVLLTLSPIFDVNDKISAVATIAKNYAKE